MGMMDLKMNAMTSLLSPDDKQDTMLKMMPEMEKQIKKENIMVLMGSFMKKRQSGLSRDNTSGVPDQSHIMWFHCRC